MMSSIIIYSIVFKMPQIITIIIGVLIGNAITMGILFLVVALMNKEDD